ncbi:MAG TPA: glutamine-hydrolyzing carbamoyl-phosphate synthase small subunit [Thermomicrobiales bacterium]|nr:glutamine-hydrolyzing carbamoyl-phosphate synthase small subunit [Thermomicrobiales bacterium]
MPGKSISTTMAHSDDIVATHRGPRYVPPADAALALADGRVFRGFGFGASIDAQGEVVFTTTMIGYQEVATDPSFRGQIVCMTYPLIGNYGIHPEADESRRPWISGLVVREHSDKPSHAGSTGTIHEYLRHCGIPGISGIDTRALTLHIREVGDTRGVIVREAHDISDSDLTARARDASLPGEYDAVGQVTTHGTELIEGVGPHIVVLDCGVKRNIIRSLVKRGARVTVVPFGTGLAEIERLQPDGVVVSPGPGDPANLDSGLDVVTGVLERNIPYFGICLGHQLLARSIGAETRKLKFGHRGGNHSVRDTKTGHVTITSQNHGYEVDASSVPAGTGWEVRLINLNDGSVEGLAHRDRPALTVQFHPESSPGPLDNDHLFDTFLDLVRASAVDRRELS